MKPILILGVVLLVLGLSHQRLRRSVDAARHRRDRQYRFGIGGPSMMREGFRKTLVTIRRMITSASRQKTELRLASDLMKSEIVLKSEVCVKKQIGGMERVQRPAPAMCNHHLL